MRPTIETLETRRLMSYAPVNGPADADFDANGAINSADFTALAISWNTTGTKTHAQGDTNGDNAVDTIDLNALTRWFGSTYDVSPQPPIAGNWTQIFNDDFDSNVSPIQRGYAEQMWGLDNDGFGGHINDATNLTVNNGVMALTATRVAAGGKQYTTAQVQTGGNLAAGGSTPPLLSFKYGYIESRIDIPEGAGLWPAFWMMPTPNPDCHDGDGEIDIIDNGSGDPTNVTIGVGKHGTHFGGDNKATIGAGYHTVGLDWQADHIDWYLDGVRFAHDTDLSTIPTVNMYLIMGLQICDGGWGNPPTNTPLPQSMLVDYVRVWQK